MDNSAYQQEYDDEPIVYCKQCLSLKIVNINLSDDDSFTQNCYCEDCGSTNISQTDIDTWNNLFEKRYNKNFLYGTRNRKQDEL